MRHMPQIAHVDVTFFYASAERAFNPSLEGRPVIVLSNNDACAVTRSPEAKGPGLEVYSIDTRHSSASKAPRKVSRVTTPQISMRQAAHQRFPVCGGHGVPVADPVEGRVVLAHLFASFARVFVDAIPTQNGTPTFRALLLHVPALGPKLLSRADPVMIRDRFSVVMMPNVLELQGTPASRWRKNASAGTSSSSPAPSRPPSPPPPGSGRS